MEAVEGGGNTASVDEKEGGRVLCPLRAHVPVYGVTHRPLNSTDCSDTRLLQCCKLQSGRDCAMCNKP